jgi:hypothetical protein
MAGSDPLAAEKEFAIRMARVDDDETNDAELVRLLARPLDWNWIVITATRHKIVQLLWHNLMRKDLVGRALGTGGLPELWTVYIAQMHAAGARRNRMWLDNAANVSTGLADAGIPAVILKGGALIDDIYTAENRFLNDIDFLAKRADAENIKKTMYELGYEYGSYNYATGEIDPIDRRVARAWMFNNHVMPNFYRLTGDPLLPYYKIQVGFDFFDPFEDYTVDSVPVVDSAAPKPVDSRLMVPSLVDTLTNLCCHIYREGVSLVYDDYNVNWQLGKFCDLLSFLLKYDAQLDVDKFSALTEERGVTKPMFYAFHHTYQVYEHPVLTRWLRATDSGDHAYLTELRDGSKRIQVTEPFMDRLFSLRNVRAEPLAGWNKQFRRDQW